jgi:cholesterol transport system auxiliary component
MRSNVNDASNRFLRTAALVLSCAALLGGCASKGEPRTLYDFGPLPAAAPPGAPALPALVVADATGPAALDTQTMYYRLNYADPLQARGYASNHWNSTPLQMITQRFKSRFAQSGMKVLSVTDASGGIPLLRVEVDDFTQAFDSPLQNHGEMVLRASLFQGRKLIDQKTFSSKTASHSADAAGGTRALAESTDAIAADILAWLAAMPMRKE